MHHFTRALGVLLPAVALTAGTLVAADAGEPAPTVGERLGQIALVDDAVPLEDSPARGVSASGSLALDLGDDATIRLGLPAEGATRVGHADGRFVLPAGDAAQLAIAPTATGAQVLVGIESAEAPTRYEFALDAPAGFTAEATDAGTVDLVSADGALAAQIAAPWAIDAEGRHVPTRFELHGDTVIQVVDHRADDYAYPIVADPKVKFCDFGTAACVKLSKSETKRGYNGIKTGAAKDAAKAVCGIVALAGGPAAIVIGGVCVAAVSIYVTHLRGKFKQAASSGKCIEMKFRIIGPPIVTGKVVKC